MQVPLQITFEGGLEPSDALRTRVEREATKLERFSERITACRVSIVGRSGRRRHGDLYEVKVRLSLPGRDDVVVDKSPDADHAHEDPYVTVRDAFNAARRRLQDHERRFGGKVKSRQAPPHGRVARIFPEEGYGFIESSDGLEIYFHRNAVVDHGFERLAPGARVRFVESWGDTGAQASTVQPLGKTHIVERA
jgi:cold shock CspA family protein/ribosome-associated translation inhibitor RaiA